MEANVARQNEQWIEFENCVINTKDVNFISSCNFAYSSGVINIKFTNCTINKSGTNTFMYDYSLTHTGNIVFDNCKLNIENECELFTSLYNTTTRGYKNLRFTFINTEFPLNFKTTNIDKTNGEIKVEIY